MIEDMNIKLASYGAILNFTGNKISFQKKIDVLVLKNNESYLMIQDICNIGYLLFGKKT